MKFSEKFKIVILTIGTFGLIWLKWKKMNQRAQNQIYQEAKTAFKNQDFFKVVPRDLIEKLEKTNSRLVFTLKTGSKVNLEELKKFKKIKGIMFSNLKLSLITNEFTNATFLSIEQELGEK
ncbi:hypothetical protein [Mycoplasma sp. Ms02]|uniref:hypothetical protein n=1 Tax=Mycoplasma sp. Ms02 TaxID=353851 RepID=UPI001C88FB53|nr:hypothetical protein [Mycoplasma sp. Ms02]QZE12317.1 hypothetical protein K4L35_03220 [Mycoplasma sp. Ms02]